VKAEYIAMKLAALCTLNVAPVSMIAAAGKDVLLIERFDRIQSAAGWQRRAMVSALTMLGLDEMMRAMRLMKILPRSSVTASVSQRQRCESSTDGSSSIFYAAIRTTMPATMPHFGTARCSP